MKAFYRVARIQQHFITSKLIVFPSKARDLGLCLRGKSMAEQTNTKVPRFAREDTTRKG
jgi:hypothetical protein